MKETDTAPCGAAYNGTSLPPGESTDRTMNLTLISGLAYRARFLTVVLIAGLPTLCPGEETGSSDSLRLFEERIMPIFNSPKPSSCVQCHLSSVDIKNYILPSHTDTFIALREGGLINVDAPEKSKILTLIKMGDKDLDRGARLIHEKTRLAEYEAFSGWIKACCDDRELVALSARIDLPTVGPEKPLEVVRHARKSRLLESFTRNVWSQRMRCFPCHTPGEIDKDNPKHRVPAQRHADFVAKYGQKMNIFQATPEATLSHMMTGSRHQKSDRYPMINLDDAQKSLLVLKPTAKLPPKKEDGTFEKPSSKSPVSHMGGLKMHRNDQSYKAFIAWIKDYTAIVGDAYATADDLPTERWQPTQRILRVREVPESWGTASVVQLFVHAHDASSDSWSEKPVAFTQGTITPRRFVNGPLFLMGTPTAQPTQDADHPAALQPGKYMVRAFVDSDDEISAAPEILLGQEHFVGQATIDAQWQIGFPKAETFSAQQFEK